jgi:hypothetical protein
MPTRKRIAAVIAAITVAVGISLTGSAHAVQTPNGQTAPAAVTTADTAVTTAPVTQLLYPCNGMYGAECGYIINQSRYNLGIMRVWRGKGPFYGPCRCGNYDYRMGPGQNSRDSARYSDTAGFFIGRGYSANVSMQEVPYGEFYSHGCRDAGYWEIGNNSWVVETKPGSC